MSDRKKVVSYSQYSKWYNCPHSWELDYIKGLKTFEFNLNLTYGNAMHETLQHYVKTLYQEGLVKATMLQLKDIFIDAMVKEVFENKIECTENELQEFIEDGVNFLNEFMKASVRLEHFPANKYEFVGIEDKLDLELINNRRFWGFIDLVLREKETGRIKIIDFKTSALGWNTAQKEDLAKTSQVILYKALYSKQHNVPISKIDVEFFILKRKLYNNPKYKYRQSRIQIFRPPADKKEVTRVINHFTQFLSESFNPDGTYNEKITYPKIPGKNKKNCKWCLYKGGICDAIPDIKD